MRKNDSERRRWGIGAILVASILLATSSVASAQIYRWQDASGRDQFAQDLESISAEHREAARKRWDEANRRMSVTGGVAPPTRSTSDEAVPAAPREEGLVGPRFGRDRRRPSREDPEGPGGLSESGWRLAHRQHTAAVEVARRRIAAIEASSSAPTEFDYSRRARKSRERARWERNKAMRAGQRAKSRRLAEAALALDAAEKRHEAFRERARRAGVPPGWLREP